MNDISGFGLQVTLVASKTFPSGLTLTQFADDGDSLDLPSIQIAETAMGLNGHLVKWSRANPLPLTLNMIPSSEDDKNLQVIFEANRPGSGKRPAGDILTLTVVYPSGDTATFTQGCLTDGMPANSVASAGRLKTKPYVMAFENLIVT